MRSRLFVALLITLYQVSCTQMLYPQEEVPYMKCPGKIEVVSDNLGSIMVHCQTYENSSITVFSRTHEGWENIAERTIIRTEEGETRLNTTCTHSLMTPTSIIIGCGQFIHYFPRASNSFLPQRTTRIEDGQPEGIVSISSLSVTTNGETLFIVSKKISRRNTRSLSQCTWNGQKRSWELVDWVTTSGNIEAAFVTEKVDLLFVTHPYGFLGAPGHISAWDIPFGLKPRYTLETPEERQDCVLSEKLGQCSHKLAISMRCLRVESVKVFCKDQDIPRECQTIDSPNAERDISFGWSISMSQDCLYMTIGATNAKNIGMVYVYKNIENSYEHIYTATLEYIPFGTSPEKTVTVSNFNRDRRFDVEVKAQGILAQNDEKRGTMYSYYSNTEPIQEHKYSTTSSDAILEIPIQTLTTNSFTEEILAAPNTASPSLDPDSPIITSIHYNTSSKTPSSQNGTIVGRYNMASINDAPYLRYALLSLTALAIVLLYVFYYKKRRDHKNRAGKISNKALTIE